MAAYLIVQPQEELIEDSISLAFTILPKRVKLPSLNSPQSHRHLGAATLIEPHPDFTFMSHHFGRSKAILEHLSLMNFP